jgi:hypothetical protein
LPAYLAHIAFEEQFQLVFDVLKCKEQQKINTQFGLPFSALLFPIISQMLLVFLFHHFITQVLLPIETRNHEASRVSARRQCYHTLAEHHSGKHKFTLLFNVSFLLHNFSNFSLNTLLQGIFLTLSSLYSIGVRAACPFATVPGAHDSHSFPHGSISQGWGENGERQLRHLEKAAGDWGDPDAGYEAVMADIEVLLNDSQDFWPADFGN